MNLSKNFSVALIVAGLAISSAATFAKPAVKTKKDKEIIEALQKGLPVEMPLRAATMVKDATAADRKEVAVRVVGNAIELRPQLTAAFVSAIVKVAPETTADVVAAATKAQPSQREAILAAVPRTVSTSNVEAPAANSPSSAGESKVSAFANPTPGGPFQANQNQQSLDPSKSQKAEGSGKTSNGAQLDQNPPNEIILPTGKALEINRGPGFKNR